MQKKTFLLDIAVDICQKRDSSFTNGGVSDNEDHVLSTVVDKVVQVDVLALEGVVGVALDGLGLAVDALGVVETGPLGRVEDARVVLGQPLGLLVLHVLRVDQTVVIELWTGWSVC